MVRKSRPIVVVTPRRRLWCLVVVVVEVVCSVWWWWWWLRLIVAVGFNGSVVCCRSTLIFVLEFLLLKVRNDIMFSLWVGVP